MPSSAGADVQDTHDDAAVLCYCEWVTRAEIVAALPHVRSVKELRERTRACMTCFGCEADLDELVEAHQELLGSALV